MRNGKSKGNAGRKKFVEVQRTSDEERFETRYYVEGLCNKCTETKLWRFRCLSTFC